MTRIFLLSLHRQRENRRQCAGSRRFRRH